MKNNSGCLCRGNLHDPQRILRTPPRLYSVVYVYVVATITMNHAAIAEPSSLPPSPQVAICTVSQCDIFRWAQAKQAVCVCVYVPTVAVLHKVILAMPQKRINLAASLRAQGPAKKAARMDDQQESGPLVACVRPWGNAAWVFKGRLAPAVFSCTVHNRVISSGCCN